MAVSRKIPFRIDGILLFYILSMTYELWDLLGMPSTDEFNVLFQIRLQITMLEDCYAETE